MTSRVTCRHPLQLPWFSASPRSPAQNTTEPAKTQPKGNTVEPGKKPDATKRDSTKPDAAKPKKPTKPKYEKATFGAGCFWHVEFEYDRLPGVLSAVSGYSGGDPRFRSYDMVHEGWTGHAEVVQVTYDPEIITYEDLLKVFWACHDPTTLNRQGLDEGPQYRSVIFYHNKEQMEAAVQVVSEPLIRSRLCESDRDPAHADERILCRGAGTPRFLRR